MKLSSILTEFEPVIYSRKKDLMPIMAHPYKANHHADQLEDYGISLKSILCKRLKTFNCRFYEKCHQVSIYVNPKHKVYYKNRSHSIDLIIEHVRNQVSNDQSYLPSNLNYL